MHTIVRVLHLRSAAINGIGGDESLLLRVYIIAALAFVPHSSPGAPLLIFNSNSLIVSTSDFNILTSQNQKRRKLPAGELLMTASKVVLTS